MLSTDGSEGDAYTLNSIRWSPDSKKLAAFRRRPGYQRLVHYVESSPTDQVQPKHTTNFYRKPGDVVDFDHPVIFDVQTKRQMPGDIALFPNPYANTRLEWRSDSRSVTFEYNQRGHQVYRVLEIDATAGRTRTLIEETQKTFVEYSGKRFREDVADGKEIIWASERDGWNHLYLYDGATGRVKNQITKGPWVVRSVDRVDAENRQIWFRASGMQPGKDPYFVHYYRVNFDGTGLTALTDADGSHTVTFSPDRQFYVDSWSRVDLPQVSVLKRTSDRQVVMELEKGDASALVASGWRMPEPFMAKGRDGTTDIWGVIIRPTNFDPGRRYPVIENIYAGPQSSFVPKTFGLQAGMMSLAELGFIVVQIDGMGTSNRSKAFHDVAWQNLGDAGLPDRILWHKAVAAKYPYVRSLARRHLRDLGGRSELGRRPVVPSRVLPRGVFELRVSRQPDGQDLVERAVDGMAHRTALRGSVQCRQRAQAEGSTDAPGARDGHQRRPLVHDAGGERAHQGEQDLRAGGRAGGEPWRRRAVRHPQAQRLVREEPARARAAELESGRGRTVDDGCGSCGSGTRLRTAGTCGVFLRGAMNGRPRPLSHTV